MASLVSVKSSQGRTECHLRPNPDVQVFGAANLFAVPQIAFVASAVARERV